MNDERAMYAAVLAAPEDDTVRLAYADFLDERERPAVSCTGCRGSKRDDWGRGSGFAACPRCGGRGEHPFEADHHRAEFIRAQVELNRITGDVMGRLFAGGSGPDPLVVRHSELATVAAVLAAAHPDWLRSGCPACRGSGRGALVRTSPREWAHCAACGGTGDLFDAPRRHLGPIDCYGCGRAQPAARMNPPKSGPTGVRCLGCGLGVGRRRVELRRGFVDEVSCLLGELGACAAAGRPFAAAPWAAAVFRGHPVTRLRVLDRRPDSRRWAGAGDLTAGYAARHPDPWHLPLQVFDLLEGYDHQLAHDDQPVKVYARAHEADEALYRAAAALARGGS